MYQLLKSFKFISLYTTLIQESSFFAFNKLIRSICETIIINIIEQKAIYFIEKIIYFCYLISIG